MSKKALINLLLKIAISGFALYYVFSHINLNQIAEKVSASNPWLLLSALIVYALSQLASALRLKVLFKHSHSNFSKGEHQIILAGPIL
jgi:glycosyltransferase 2 family protein